MAASPEPSSKPKWLAPLAVGGLVLLLCKGSRGGNLSGLPGGGCLVKRSYVLQRRSALERAEGRLARERERLARLERQVAVDEGEFDRACGLGGRRPPLGAERAPSRKGGRAFANLATRALGAWLKRS